MNNKELTIIEIISTLVIVVILIIILSAYFIK